MTETTAADVLDRPAERLGKALIDSWKLRVSIAASLAEAESQCGRRFGEATKDDLVALLESFAPTRAGGPDWTRTFNHVIEHMWWWCDSDVIKNVAAEFEARGPVWAAISYSLSPEYGEQVRARLMERGPLSRFPQFTMA